MIDDITNDMKDSSFELTRYLLLGNLRFQILKLLNESDKTLIELKTELQKSESNILHYLKDLEEKDVIEKNHNKYTLTTKGFLITNHVIKLFNNWKAINQNRSFINNHVETKLPLNFILNMDIWKDAQRITASNFNYNQTRTTYIELISKSNYITIILPSLSKDIIESILLSVKENSGKLTLITSKLIINKIKNSEISRLYTKLVDNNQINVVYTTSHKKLHYYITVTENFATLELFYNDGNVDDSEMLLIQDKEKINLLQELIEENKYNF